MSCVKLTPSVTQSLAATSTTVRYVWFTDWMPAMAMDAASGVLKVANLANSFRVKPAYQTATVRVDDPDAPNSSFGSEVSSDSENFISEATFDLDNVTPGKTFIRFGVAVYLNTAPNNGTADVTLQMAYRQCGSLGAPWTGHLVATSTTEQFQPLTGWLPALGVVKVEATIIVGSTTGNFEVALAYRTALASPELPAAWADVTGTGEWTNGEQNSGEKTVSVTDKMWVQIGVRYNLTEAGSPGQADVAVMLGVRSSG